MRKLPLYHIATFVIRNLYLVILPAFLPAQNLLPDGGFEKELINNCGSPVEAFKKLEHWYILDATPDLFEVGCYFNEEEFIYWEEGVEPYEGKNYAGIWSRWNSNNSFFSEGIATRFSEPLEAGKTYFFEMHIINQGTFQGLGELTGCTLEPDKHIDLYISSDSIVVTPDFSNGTASTSAQMVATLNSEDIQNESTEDWSVISTCFQAQGGEAFFALILPLGTFGPLPPCAMADATSGVFRSFYYFIDAASVKEFSGGEAAEHTICEGEMLEVDLLDWYELPILEEATFVWTDGQQGNRRTISEPGEYQIIANVECAQIPLTFRLLTEECSADIYIPNVFSPNGDGVNDEFQVFPGSPEQLLSYELQVLDRWGNVVFRSNDKEQAWNGEHRGQALSQGIYTWALRYEVEVLGVPTQRIDSGSVLLVR